jgi:signal transduction histidine kinase
LRRRVTALCLLVAVVLAFLATGATVTAVANRGQLDTLVEISAVRTASDGLLTALVNQETALRGYVLTASTQDISPYYIAVQEQKDQTANISSSPAATPLVQQELLKVTESASAWRDAVAGPAIQKMTSRDQAGASALIDDTARDQFTAVRTALTALQNTVQGMLNDAVSAIQDNSSTLLFVLILVAVLGIGGAVALLVALQQVVIGPVTYLAGRVRSVAQGDYDLEISTTGPPELENLAHDVDQMRRQIASDLAEVDRSRRQIEQAAHLLEQQTAELTRSNRDLEQFAYVASHDLQEPLRKVTSFCQLLQRRYAGQLDERADEYIAFAVSGAQRMQRLINDLLAFSRIGRNTAGFSEIDLGRVMADASGDRSEVVWSGLPVVRGEETLLVTLFANLIGNSLKFHRPDTTPTVLISARAAGAMWEVSCVDNGLGIEPEFAEKVFVIFQRLHARDAYPGTGIGLAVAKKIVEYHGGQIWVDTEYTGGTAIRLTLPAVA